MAVWLDSQSQDEVSAVWVSARPAAPGTFGFDEHLRAALHSTGMVPAPPAGGPRPSGLDELDAAILAEAPGRRFVLVIDNFDHVRDEPTLAELLSLVERHRHFHLFACYRAHPSIEALAAGMTGVKCHRSQGAPGGARRGRRTGPSGGPSHRPGRGREACWARWGV